MAAADAADSLANLWKISGQTSLQHLRSQSRTQRDIDMEQSSVWAKATAGEITAKTAYSHRYRQNYSGVTVGADRSFALDAATGSIGFSAGSIRSNADYMQGRGDLTGTALGLYGQWSADNGSYALFGANASSLKNRYTTRDSEGRAISGEYRTEAGQLYVEGGHTFELANAYYIEPYLGLSVGNIRGNAHTTSNGVRVDHGKLDTSFAGTGVTFGKVLQSAQHQGSVYARVSALHYLGDNLDIVASKDGGSIAPETLDRKGTEGELAVGGDIVFGNKRTGLFLEASGSRGAETKRHWNVQIGLRHSW